MLVDVLADIAKQGKKIAYPTLTTPEPGECRPTRRVAGLRRPEHRHTPPALSGKGIFAVIERHRG
jgi:hypothetical protein